MDLLQMLWGLVRDWRKAADSAFAWLSGTAGIVALISTDTGQRPSELVSSVVEFLGWSGLSDWFRVDAPRAITLQSADVQFWALLGAAVPVTVMVVTLLWNGRGDVKETAYAANAVIGGRSAGTFWLLVLVAAQQGPLAQTLERTPDAVGLALVVVACVVAAAAVLRAIGRRVGLETLTTLVSLLLRTVACVSTALAAATFAVIMSVISLPLTIASWLLDPRSVAARRADLTARDAIRSPLPTGAVSKPTHVGRS